MSDHKQAGHSRVWIIGASSGIGEALAYGLAVDGARVALSARRKGALDKIASTLAGSGHMVLPLDVGDSDAVADAFSRLCAEWDGIDSVIFMAASYTPHTSQRKDIATSHHLIDINFKAAITVVETVLPLFYERGRGQIVLCGSVAGYRGLPNGQPYCATKAALINYAESLKIELEPHNIDIKVINPGFVKTPLTDKNDFPMPMMITADAAAQAIQAGLRSRAFEIHFPKRFTWIMKILRILPSSLYFMIARRMRRQVGE